MKNKLWEAVFAVFEAVDRDGTGQLEAERLIALRKTLRLKLDILRSELAIQLNDREIYHVLFPVVVYLDEILQSRVLPGERVDLDHLTVEVLAARDEAPPLGHTDAHGLRCVLRRVTIRAHVLRRVEREL